VEFAPQRAVPIFPLPGTVLFPCTQLPLHVFELRYRTMVREALSAERLMVLALLKPGWERDYRATPAFFPLGCLARFEEVCWLHNDCYDIQVLGMSRVTIGSVVRDFPYRAARVRMLPQEPVTEDDPLIALEKRALIDVHTRLLRELAHAPVESIDPAASFETLVNGACMTVPALPAHKLSLLEMDNLLERSQRVREWMEMRLRQSHGGESAGSPN
jgi:Lon protease-like protein